MTQHNQAIKKCVDEMCLSLEKLGNVIVARDGHPENVYPNALSALGILVASHIRCYAGEGEDMELVTEFHRAVALFLGKPPLDILKAQGSA